MPNPNLQGQRASRRVSVTVQATVSGGGGGKGGEGATPPLPIALANLVLAWPPRAHPCTPATPSSPQAATLPKESYIEEVPQSLLRPGIDDPDRCAVGPRGADGRMLERPPPPPWSHKAPVPPPPPAAACAAALSA